MARICKICGKGHSVGNSVSHANPFNTAFDKGPSDFDHTHVFGISGLWELPVKFESRAANLLLGGWKLTGIAAMQSGATFTVASGADNARTGTGGQRADLIGNPYLASNRSRNEVINQYLNKAAFAPNALGTFGSLGRNSFRGPSMANVDLGLHKNFRVTERFNTQFRFESFNTLNRVNLGSPETNFASANFQRITSAGDPRILQFALRLQW